MKRKSFLIIRYTVFALEEGSRFYFPMLLSTSFIKTDNAYMFTIY